MTDDATRAKILAALKKALGMTTSAEVRAFVEEHTDELAALASGDPAATLSRTQRIHFDALVGTGLFSREECVDRARAVLLRPRRSRWR